MNCYFRDNELDQMLFVLLHMCRRFMDLLKNVQNKPFLKFSSATCICNLNIIYQWVPAFLCDDKMCTWHTIPWLNSWNKLKFKFKFSVYLWHFQTARTWLAGTTSPAIYELTVCGFFNVSQNFYTHVWCLLWFIVFNGQKNRKSNRF